MFIYALAFALGVILLDSSMRSEEETQLNFSDSEECSEFVKDFDTWSPELQSNFSDWSLTCEMTPE